MTPAWQKKHESYVQADVNASDLESFLLFFSFFRQYLT